MIVIRMARAGKKNSPFYHVVAAEKFKPRDGKYLERLGTYKPEVKDDAKKLTLDMAAVDTWIKKGAIPSPLVAQLIKKTKKSQK